MTSAFLFAAWVAAADPAGKADIEQRAVDIDRAMEAAYGAGEYERAYGLAKESLSLREEGLGPTHTQVADSLHNMAVAELGMGRHQEAIDLLRRALELREASPPADPEEQIGALYFLASAQQSLGRYTEARATLEGSLERIERELGPDDPQIARASIPLSAIALIQGDLEFARDRADRAASIYLDSGDLQGAANTLRQLARTAKAQGHLNEALVLQRRALDATREAYGPQHPHTVATTSGLAYFLMLAGHLAEAESTCREAMSLSTGSDRLALQRAASMTGMLGQIRWRRGHLREAEGLLEHAVRETSTLRGEDSPHLIAPLTTLGHIMNDIGNPKAIEVLSRARSIEAATAGTTTPAMAMILGALGNAFVSEGDYAGARRFLEQSVRMGEATLGPSNADVAAMRVNLADALARVNDDLGAMRAYETALQALRESVGLNHTNTLHTEMKLAATYFSQGRFDEARVLLEHAIAAFKAIDPDHFGLFQAHSAHGTSLEYAGRLEEARQSYDRAMDLAERTYGTENPKSAAILAQKGAFLARRGESENARIALEQALEIQRRVLPVDDPQLAMTLDALSMPAIAEGDVSGAAAHYREAAELITRFVRRNLAGLSERESLALVRDNRVYIRRLVSLENRPEHVNSTYDLVVEWKGLVSRILGDRHAAAVDALDPEVQRDWRELGAVRGELATATLATSLVEHERIENLSLRKEHLERTLARQLDTTLPIPDRREICDALPSHSAIVDFFRFNHRKSSAYGVWITRSGDCEKVHRVNLYDGAAIDAAVKGWREAVASSDALQTRIDRRGRDLEELVWAPLAGFVADSEHVIIVPDGTLVGVSFAALPLQDGRYLLEDHLVSYLESSTQWVAESKQRGSGALVVAGVDYGPAESPQDPAACRNESYGLLPATRGEATAIEGLLRKRREEIVSLTGADANEEKVAEAAPGKRLIHLATHGFFASPECRSALTEADRKAGAVDTSNAVGFNPMVLSGLVLADANAVRDPTADDGIWTAEEVSSLDLRGVETVVMSACETGLGEVQSGEGVLGLRRAFATAGAGSLVMSLWPVPDMETSVLMKHFYRELLGRKKPPSAVALRKAQLHMLEQNREAGPAAWGAFIAAGA